MQRSLFTKSAKKALYSGAQWQDQRQHAATETQESPAEHQETRLLWGWISTGTDFPGRLWSLSHCRYSKDIGTWFWTTSFDGTTWARGFGQDVPSILNQSVIVISKIIEKVLLNREEPQICLLNSVRISQLRWITTNWNASVREIKERDHQQRLVFFIWSKFFLGNSVWELWSSRSGSFFCQASTKNSEACYQWWHTSPSSVLIPLSFTLLALLSTPCFYKATRVWSQPEMLWQSLQSMRFFSWNYLPKDMTYLKQIFGTLEVSVFYLRVL